MDQLIQVHIEDQLLSFYCGDRLIASYPISTAKAGLGEREGSWKTPRGRHVIQQKCGSGLPLLGVLKGRKYQGYDWAPQLVQNQLEQDWIIARVLWLSGIEPSNRAYPYSSYHRYIYIHGTPPDQKMREPESKGCIRMRATDIVALFEMVREGCLVDILP